MQHLESDDRSRKAGVVPPWQVTSAKAGSVKAGCGLCNNAAFYVHEHNAVLPHSAFRGQTPDEMYLGTGDAVPDELASRAAAARRARREANRAAVCETCPSVHAAA